MLAGVGVRHQDADVLLQELGALVPEVVAQAGVGPQDAAIPPAGGAGTSCLLPSLECLIPGAADHVCCMVCHILSQNKISYIAQACERHFRDQKICKSTEIVFLDRFVPPRPEKLHLGGSLGRSHCVWGGVQILSLGCAPGGRMGDSCRVDHHQSLRAVQHSIQLLLNEVQGVGCPLGRSARCLRDKAP